MKNITKILTILIALSINSTITLAGTIIQTNNTFFTEPLIVSNGIKTVTISTNGDINASGNINVSNLTANGSINASSLTVSNDLNISGSIIVSNGIKTVIISTNGDINASGNINVSNLTANGSINVTSLTVSNDLNVSGSIFGHEVSTNILINKLLLMTSASTNFSFLSYNTNMAASYMNLAYGKIYATNAGLFSKTLTLTFYDHSDRKGSNAYWRANILLLSTPLYVDGYGTNIITVADTTGFSINDLVWFGGISNEFARITNVTPNTISFEDNLTMGHASNDVVTKVAEFGGFSLMDKTETGNFWAKLTASTAFTNNFKIDLLIK